MTTHLRRAQGGQRSESLTGQVVAHGLLVITFVVGCTHNACPPNALPVTPPTITVVAPRPPCPLPARPQPLALASLIPAPDGAHWMMTTADAAELAAYVEQEHAWERAAAACLGAKP